MVVGNDRHDADGRAGEAAEVRNLAGAAHSHLNYGRFMVRRQLQKRLWNAGFTILAGGCFKNWAKRRQGGSEHFFNGRFADAAGDADDRDVKLVAPKAGQQAISHLRVRDAQDRNAGRCNHRLRDNQPRRARPQGRCDVLVAVRLRPQQSDK